MLENDINNRIVLDAKPRSKLPSVLIGLPDVGLVGSIAVNYIIEELKMEEIGYIDADVYHPIVIVKDGNVQRPIRLYEKNNIIALISDIPITPVIAIDFSIALVSWLKSINSSLLINITGIPIHNRVAIEKPEVLALTTDYHTSIESIKPFRDGVIMGTYASIIKECVNNNIPSITLLAQSYLNFPDPAASISALDVINKILNLDISLKRLEEEAEVIRLKARELMKQAEGTLTRSKVGVPSIYR